MIQTKGTLVASVGIKGTKISIDEVSLVIVGGPHQGQEYQLHQELIRIGRSDWCDIVLSKDRKVSGEHCECWLDEAGVRIKDLGSRNGILLNQCRIFDAYVAPGVQVQVGDSLFELRLQKTQRKLSILYEDASGKLVGKHPKMRKLFSLLSKIGPRDIPVLLTGETGTGKTSIARAIHEQSPRFNGPFVVVNCGALPSSLIESSLFGHEKGAFTSAGQRHHGFFEQAQGGTLFLDELGELPFELQPKLLDVLERKRIRRLGSEQEIQVDFRLITATHRDLPAAIAQKQFREDLYYRMAVVELDIPPLRERMEDLPLLLEYLTAKLFPNRPLQITPQAIKKLQQHLWPGNVRELQNILERSLLFIDNNVLDADDIMLKQPRLPENTSQYTPPPEPEHDQRVKTTQRSLQERLDIQEKQIVISTLESLNWDIQQATTVLGLSRSRLYSRIKKYGLQRP